MSSTIIYLYIKQHSITGLKYFGKTTRANPYSYKGSGKHWLRHIKKHGRKYVETIQVWQFSSANDASEFALNFSKTNNIVESAEWANLIEENAFDGAPVGHSISEQARQKISLTHKGKIAYNKGVPMSEEQKIKISNTKLQKQYKRTEESRRLQSERQKGRTGPNKGRVWITLGTRVTNKLVTPESAIQLYTSGYRQGRVL